jgi:hypothetical protein
MATRSAEIPRLYGHGANPPSRERAGYRPKLSPQEEENLRNYTGGWIVSGLIKWLAPKGDPDSYTISR